MAQKRWKICNQDDIFLRKNKVPIFLFVQLKHVYRLYEDLFNLFNLKIKYFFIFILASDTYYRYTKSFRWRIRKF